MNITSPEKQSATISKNNRVLLIPIDESRSSFEYEFFLEPNYLVVTRRHYGKVNGEREFYRLSMISETGFSPHIPIKIFSTGGQIYVVYDTTRHYLG